LAWLRNNDPTASDLADPAISLLAKFVGMSILSNSMPSKNKKQIVDADFNWIRNNQAQSSDVHVQKLPVLFRLEFASHERHEKSVEIVEWICKTKSNWRN
jgi:hypothetical protein